MEELDLRGERLQYKRLLDLKEWMNSGMWMFPKIEGKTPKMDGENNGKAYENS